MDYTTNLKIPLKKRKIKFLLSIEFYSYKHFQSSSYKDEDAIIMTAHTIEYIMGTAQVQQDHLHVHFQ